MKQQAVGMIETRGLIGAIEAADKAVKAAEVALLGYQVVTGGLVMITVTGEVAAVQAAVSAGSVAAAQVGQLISQHVIPRPLAEIGLVFQNTPDLPGSRGGDRNQKGTEPEHPVKEAITEITIKKSEEDMEHLQQKLQSMSVEALRRAARKTKGIAIKGRQISGTNKDRLIREILQAKRQEFERREQ